MNKKLSHKILAFACLVVLGISFTTGCLAANDKLPVNTDAPPANVDAPPNSIGEPLQLNVPIPGLEGDVNLPNYIKALYKFGIGALAILCMGMIMVGGYQYMVSAGESITKTSEAKARIQNAIIGLVIALTSFLLLNTINPNILKPVELAPVVKTTAKNIAPVTAKQGQACGFLGGANYVCEGNGACLNTSGIDVGETGIEGICGEGKKVGEKDYCTSTEDCTEGLTCSYDDLIFIPGAPNKGRCVKPASYRSEGQSCNTSELFCASGLKCELLPNSQVGRCVLSLSPTPDSGPQPSSSPDIPPAPEG